MRNYQIQDKGNRQNGFVKKFVNIFPVKQFFCSLKILRMIATILWNF